ncbi:TPA: hypothetical protein ACQZLU_001049 [Klebsiella pneumoniae]
MTKSTITREQLLEIIETDHVQCGEASYLARMALAAMDSEPVAVIDKEGNPMTRDECNDDRIFAICCKVGTPLYTHPSPSIPSAVTWCPKCNDTGLADSGGVQPWGEPILIECDCRAEPAPAAPVCTCPSGDGSLRWPCPVHPGNSPVIPDGWTGNEKANAALMMLDRIETVDPVDDDRIDGIKRIVRELAAAPHDTPALNSVQSVVTVPGKWIPVSEQKPDCWCLTCRPVVLNDMRFVVCPDCGNKRCPRANDHRDACTGSNEPGQEGSVYPAAQQEVKGE